MKFVREESGHLAVESPQLRQSLEFAPEISLELSAASKISDTFAVNEAIGKVVGSA